MVSLFRMHFRVNSVSLACLLLLFPGISAVGATVKSADVIVCGGSTAALATAFTAAEEGAHVVLIEPTDWIGGQLTSSGVPAVDEAWHQIKPGDSADYAISVRDIARDPRNVTPAFRDMLSAIGNPGRGWVSRFCFEPKLLLTNHLDPLERRLRDRLTVYRNTVIKQVHVDGRRITGVTAIQRIPADTTDGYSRLPSSDLGDWYSREPSSRFDKKVIEFRGRTENVVFIEATEWGEVLALTGGDYLQAIDRGDAAPEYRDDRCGQDTVFGFVQELHERPMSDTAMQPSTEITDLGWGKYEGRADVWEKVWTYRRIRAKTTKPSTSDLSLQNWGYSLEHRHGGNDYVAGYLFLSKSETRKSLDDWQGGVDRQVMASAEQRALAWHAWFRSQTPPAVGADRITMSKRVLGTGHGLSKLPYIRDTRRSIGIGGFVLKIEDLVGKPNESTGKRFDDRVAIGCYPADVHPLTSCQYPKHV
ncbi:MAG: FAD-dependent oxidoreductase, partial [Planctomycetota bacterium]